MKRVVKIFFVLLISYSYTFGQQNELAQLSIEFKKDADARRQRVLDYLKKTGDLEVFEDGKGNLYQIYDIDQFGKPVYIGTFNEGLAKTIGADKLQKGQTFGFNLRGAGIRAGVWDGGTVFGHNDFGSRLTQADFGSFSEHATHVAGTIGAGGLNQSAMGMAPDADVSSYDWNNDIAEMTTQVTSDETGLLFSNHSYGLIQGWFFNGSSWQWSGNSAISPNEDWRFGFYTTVARNLDQVAFNAPYYSIFWAVGNDRDDRGPNGPPQDGNGGSGFDCLAQEATAKNIFSIGAIRKIANYEGPQSVLISDFSNWGPTDDGRIKPDLVTPGVGILSTVLNNNYGILSGTSMATPGATGGLMLIQELHKKLYGKPMRSATLKAVAIHSAKEAGTNPGPDFVFGWGVLDVEAAAKLVFEKDNQNIFIEEQELFSNQTYEKLITPKSGTKIKVTIAWTDPAGTVSNASLDPTDKKLINDLDVRLVDENNDMQFPWSMKTGDANLGEPAIKADNSLDNVEKLEFENAQPRNYYVRVTHKGNLQGGKQAFSIIIQYESTQEGMQTLYWVGNSGNWSDPAKWSLTSGGQGGAGIPNENTKVVLDENSFVNGNHSISFNENQTVGSIFSFVNQPVELLLNGHTLKVDNDLIITSSSVFSNSNGTITTTAKFDNQAEVSFTDNDFGGLNFTIDGEGKHIVRGKAHLQIIDVKKGDVAFQNTNITAYSFTGGPLLTSLNIDGSVFKEITSWETSSNYQSFTSNLALIEANPSANINTENNQFGGTIKFTGANNSLKATEVESVLVNGELYVENNSVINNLTVENGSQITIQALKTITLGSNSLFKGNASNRTSIKGVNGKAKLNFEPRAKICFDYLDVEEIDIIGQSIVNAGQNSNLVNSNNWKKDLCENILFPDYEITNSCAKGIIILRDISQGSITQREWHSTDDGVTIYNANASTAYATVETAGQYNFKLSISNAINQEEFTIPIEVGENNLPTNDIILNGRILFSRQPGTSYQWYRNGTPIQNANERSYSFNGADGSYFVVINGDNCNLKSTDFIISSLSENNSQTNTQNNVWPIPTNDYINFKTQDVLAYEVSTLNGVTIEKSEVIPDKGKVSLLNYSEGLYVLRLYKKNGVTIHKIIKR